MNVAVITPELELAIIPLLDQWDVFDPVVAKSEAVGVFDPKTDPEPWTPDREPGVFFVAGRMQKIAEEKFNRLSQKWYKESRFMSSVHQMVLLPSYQGIIGMGEPAVSLILNTLKQRRRQWFWALEAITGEDPVPIEDRGNVRAMAAKWLQWGRDRGIIDYIQS